MYKIKKPKTCGCGEVYTKVPKQHQYSKVAPSGYWFNCKCLTTLFVPKNKVMKSKTVTVQE